MPQMKSRAKDALSREETTELYELKKLVASKTVNGLSKDQQARYYELRKIAAKPANDAIAPIPVETEDQVLGEGAVGDSDESDYQETERNLKVARQLFKQGKISERTVKQAEKERDEAWNKVKARMWGVSVSDDLKPIPVTDTEWNDPKPRGSYKLTTSAALKTPAEVSSAYGKKDPEGMKRSFGKDNQADVDEYWKDFKEVVQEAKQGGASMAQMCSRFTCGPDDIRKALAYSKPGQYKAEDAEALRPIPVNPAPMAKLIPTSKAKHVKDSDESEAKQADQRDARVIKEALKAGNTAAEIARKNGFPLQFVKDVEAGKFKAADEGLEPIPVGDAGNVPRYNAPLPGPSYFPEDGGPRYEVTAGGSIKSVCRSAKECVAAAKEIAKSMGAAHEVKAVEVQPKTYKARVLFTTQGALGKAKDASPWDENVTELADRIKQAVRAQKADGTVGMSKQNLKSLVSSRGLSFPNANAFERAFEEALGKAGVGSFVKAKDAGPLKNEKIHELYKGETIYHVVTSGGAVRYKPQGHVLSGGLYSTPAEVRADIDKAIAKREESKPANDCCYFVTT